MPEAFEDQDLTEAVFWGVDLTRARFRDVDLTGASISHSVLVNVDIDAMVDRLVINGVDVTAFVNERDPWYPLRSMLRPETPDAMRATWDALEQAWAPTMDRAAALTEAQLHERVDGEWSFVETLRHLVFAIDKWFTVPLAGGTFAPFGLPNTGSIDFPWPGLDRGADPSLADVTAARADRAAQFRSFLEGLGTDDLTRTVHVLENGPNSLRHCLDAVFEEEFHHNRYARRDLAHFA